MLSRLFCLWCMSCAVLIPCIKYQILYHQNANTNKKTNNYKQYLSIFELSFLPVIFEMYCANLHHKIRNYKSIYHFTFHNNIFSLDDYSDIFVWGKKWLNDKILAQLAHSTKYMCCSSRTICNSSWLIPHSSFTC